MKYVLVLCLLLGVAGSLFAADAYIGFGVEANGNTLDGSAAGFGWSIGMDLNRYFGLGMKTAISYDFDSLYNMEQSGLLRFYLPLNKQGLFLQAEAGSSIFFEDNESHFYFLGGVTAGWRFVIKESFYIEPYVRGGFPFIWGGGLNAGIKLFREEFSLRRGEAEIAERRVRSDEEKRL